MISAEVDGRLPYMTYPEPWRGQPKQPPEFLRPPPKPLLPSRYNGAPPNGTRLVHTQRPHSKYSPPVGTPVNLTQPKEEITEEVYPSYRLYQPSFPPFSPHYQVYHSPYTSLLRTNFVPPLSPLENYSPTTSAAATNSGTFLSPQATYSPPAAVKSNQSLLRDNRKPSHPLPPPQPTATATTTSFKVPSGKEGSLKHRILTRPEENLPHQRGPIDLQRSNTAETHRNWIPSTVSPPQSPAKTFNNNTVSVNFAKGSLIQLANGTLKKVEDMKTEDFVLSAEKSPELRLENSTVIKIEENPITRTVTITLTYNQRRTQTEVEYPLEHPFFICGKGWASCNTERTFHIYGLKVHQLQVGDVIISLTPRTPSQNSTLRSVATLTTTATTTAMTVRQVSSAGQHRPNDQTMQSNQQQINQKPPINHSISSLTANSKTTPMACVNHQTLSPESMAKKRRWSAPEQICDDDDEQQIHRKIKVE